MRKGKIDKLVEAINAKRGVEYGQFGWLTYSDIKGWGDNKRMLYGFTKDRDGNTRGLDCLDTVNNPRGTVKRLECILAKLNRKDK